MTCKNISLLFLVLTFSLFSPVMATVLPVTNTADSGPASLRDRVEQAQTGDTINFAINGNIFLNSTIYLDKNLTIAGPGADLLSIDGQNMVRLFWLGEEDTVLFSGITFTGGNAVADTSQRPGGGAFINNGFLIFEECLFHHNIAKNGGAIENDGFDGNARLTLNRCTFFANQAIKIPDNVFNTPSAGGAIYSNGAGNGGSVIQATNCTFSGNYADSTGGAIFSEGDISGGTNTLLRNCTITQNESKGVGGIREERFSAMNLQNTIVAGNLGSPSAPDIQGAILTAGHNLIGDPGNANYTPASTDIVYADALLADLSLNESPLPTHAIACGSPAADAGNPANSPALDQRGFARDASPDIGAFERNSEIDVMVNNLSSRGKGSLRRAVFLACDGDTLDMSPLDGIIYLDEVIVLDKSLSIIGNDLKSLQIHGSDSVRLFEVYPGKSVSMNWLTFRGGNPELYGGGAIQNKGHLEISFSTFRGNHAASGGALGNYGNGDTATLKLTHCTLSGNEATILDGGAIDNRAISHPAYVSLFHCTIANNRATNKGGGIYSEGNGIFEMQNTLVGNNHCDAGPDIFGGINSLGNNLIGNDQETIFTASPSDILNADPMIAYLADYGGPTLTHRLLDGSPAIDAGTDTGTASIDQRGENRNFNGTPDIGAYEYDPATRIESDREEFMLTVFPNPSQGNFSLRTSSLIRTRGLLFVFDITGRKVHEEIIPAGRETAEVFIPGLQRGIYLISLNIGDRSVSRRIIIE